MVMMMLFKWRCHWRCDSHKVTHENSDGDFDGRHGDDVDR